MASGCARLIAPTSSRTSVWPSKQLIFSTFLVSFLKSPYKSGANYLFRSRPRITDFQMELYTRKFLINRLIRSHRRGLSLCFVKEGALPRGPDFSLVISKEEKNPGDEDGQIFAGPKRRPLSPIAQVLDRCNRTTRDIQTAGGRNGRF